jgi:hypothetical protein
VSIDATYNRALTIGGLSFAISTTVSSDVSNTFSMSIAAAKTGTLTTRTDDNTGTITGEASHGVSTGNRLDVFWSGGARVGMTVGTVSGTSIPVDGGSGDVLPSAATALTICVPTEQNFDVTGDDVSSIFISCPLGGAVTFTDDSNVYIYHRAPTSTTKTYVWVEADGGTNPLAGGAVGKAYLSNQSSSAAATISGGVQYD